MQITGTHKDNRRAIVFDLGGVLIDWNPRLLYRKLLANDEKAVDDFLTTVGFNEWNLEQDRGRPFSEAVRVLCAKFPEWAELIRAYDRRWEESIGGTIQPTVRILGRLKKAGYPLYALSNWSVEKFQLVREKYDFLNWFDAILVSGEVKLVKPDPRLFELLLMRIGRTAELCIYVDDSPANVQAAEMLGFDVILYESPEGLEKALAQRGIQGRGDFKPRNH